MLAAAQKPSNCSFRSIRYYLHEMMNDLSRSSFGDANALALLYVAIGVDWIYTTRKENWTYPSSDIILMSVICWLGLFHGGILLCPHCWEVMLSTAHKVLASGTPTGCWVLREKRWHVYDFPSCVQHLCWHNNHSRSSYREGISIKLQEQTTQI